MADIPVFEAYEAKVLSLLGYHGGRLEMRVRAVDRSNETHLLYFPDAQALEAYRSDPERLAIQNEWVNSGAQSVVVDVQPVDVSP